MVSNTRKYGKILMKSIENYLCNGGEDAALRGLIPVKEGARDQADQPHCHGSCRDSEADVHARMGLHPNKDSEGNKFTYGEGKVCSIEVGGEALGLFGAVPVELVSPMGNHVGLHTSTP